MMKALETLLAVHDVSFDAHDRRIMCFAHIINLCSGQVIDATSGMAGDKNSNSLSGDNAVPSSPIAQAWTAVRAIRGSGERQRAFNCNLQNGNEEGWFTDQSSKIVKVQPLQLLRDVRTRWDSVYHMLTRLLQMRLVRPYPHHCNIC